MGADYEGQEKGIEELKSLSNDAKQYLSHHLRNSLTQILGGIQANKKEIIEEAAWHMVEDLKRVNL